jgi:hypothetical protein
VSFNVFERDVLVYKCDLVLFYLVPEEETAVHNDLFLVICGHVSWIRSCLILFMIC